MAPVAQVVVDGAGYLAFTNQAARGLFGLGAADIGRPIQDLELSYRPEYQGCHSWVDLGRELEDVGEPVLTDGEYRELAESLDLLLNPTALA